MNRFLLFCLTAIIAISLNGCRYEKTYYHTKNGKVKHVRARKIPPWFKTKERGYNKYSRRVINRWDRGFR